MVGMSQIINIQAAKTHLSRLVEEVVGGADIILAKAGKPLVRLVPYKNARAPRSGGQLAGKIWQAEDCWEPDDLALGDSPLLKPAGKVSYRGQGQRQVVLQAAEMLAEGGSDSL